MKTGRQNSSGHLAILASAGSGKTTRLTHRYIQLLADKESGAAPGRICALTFTRKAAGEIFDRIVECLCRGAAESDGAAALAGQLAIPGLDQREFARLLGLFLDNLHRAVIGTMDSFVCGVARAFPIELGIPVDFAVTDSDAGTGRELRQDILANILGSRGAGGAGAREFLEAFKQATFGAEEKGLEDILDKMTRSFHLAFRFCPDKTKWGNAKTIWADAARRDLKIYSEKELADQLGKLGQWLDEQARGSLVDARFLKSLREISGALAAYNLQAPWDERLFSPRNTVFAQILAGLEDLKKGHAGFLYNRKSVALDSAAGRALAVLAENLKAVEIKRSLEKTAGLRDLLEHYDRSYEQMSRESGRFSFTDIQHLLALNDIAGSMPAETGARREDRLYIDYRMDARLDHWLLDEFQDTSDLQWAIFRNLVSELVQGDPSGRARSFFYVGDVKQSIYRWRGGNPALFLDILKQYNRNGPVIRLETMSASYRCSRPVLETVNRVFTDLPGDCLPAQAVAAWKTVWSEHTTLNTEAKGYAALLQHAPLEKSSEQQEAEARNGLVAALLKEIQPVERGIRVGILERDNAACIELVDFLRSAYPEIGFVYEGKAAIAGNELALGLLALVRLAAHPGDEFAWQYVRMSPLAQVLERERIGRGALVLRLLSEVEEHGFQFFITEWGARLAAVCPLNEYAGQCLARLEKAAAAFDMTHSRNCNRFLQFVEEYEEQEETARGCVRIMTIHQAKGLEFDMVILPQLQHKTRMNMARADRTGNDLLYGGAPADPGWVLRPPKMVVAENDPVLGATLREVDARHCFDWLCLLYVAMTRARNALYMIASPSAESDSIRPAALLKLQLAGKLDPEPDTDIVIKGQACARLYASESGDEHWFESFRKTVAVDKQSGSVAPVAVDFSRRASRRKVLKRYEPSRQDGFERRASDLFRPVTRDILDFGSAIHELFEKIEWLDPNAADSCADAILKEWHLTRPCDPQVDRDVRRQFRECLQAREVRSALARPPGNVELWREKSFEIILGDQWISGIFDRVVIARDSKGRPVSAVVLDYKSNRNLATEADVRSRAEQYRPQMDFYRRALSAILGLPQARIALQLLFTVPARVLCL